MIPPIFTLAAVSAPVPAAGTYTYVSRMNGTTIGTSSITVTRDASGNVNLSENGTGTFNGESGWVKDTLSLSDSLAPSVYNSSGNYGGGTITTAIRFDGERATVTGDSSDASKVYGLAPNAKHFVLLDIGPFTGWFMLPAQMKAWNDAPATAIVPAFGAFALAPQISKANRPGTVPSSDVSLAVTAPMPFAVWYDPTTLVVDEVDVPTQSLVVARKP